MSYTLASTLDFLYGFVLGVQDFEDVTTSNCVGSAEAMFTLLTSAANDIDFNNFYAATTEKGETATDAAYLMTLFTQW